MVRARVSSQAAVQRVAPLLLWWHEQRARPRRLRANVDQVGAGLLQGESVRHRRGRVLQEKHHQQRNKANCGKPFASAPPLLTPPTHPPPISRLLTPESALQHLTHIQVHLTRSLR